jgi:hypothetical protein
MRHCDFHREEPSSTYWWMGTQHFPFTKSQPLHLCDACAASRQKLAESSGRTLYLDQACSRPVAAAPSAVLPAEPVAPVQPSPDLGEGAEVGGHPPSNPEPQEAAVAKVKTETVKPSCRVPGCILPQKVLGRCARCYNQAYRLGWRQEDPAGDLERRREYDARLAWEAGEREAKVGQGEATSAAPVVRADPITLREPSESPGQDRSRLKAMVGEEFREALLDHVKTSTTPEWAEQVAAIRDLPRRTMARRLVAGLVLLRLTEGVPADVPRELRDEWRAFLDELEATVAGPGAT